MKNYILLLTIFILVKPGAFSQTISTHKTRLLHFSLVPGLSTNGIHGGKYRNTISLNLFSGYSNGNNFLEVGGLSNFNQSNVYGLQVAGLANVLGGNAFLVHDINTKSDSEDDAGADLVGIQISGIMNLLTGKLHGLQATGGINTAREDAIGFQAAGVANVVHESMMGMQIAGFQNTSYKALDGGQIAGIYNYTSGAMQGFQISAFNQAKSINGKRSTSPSRATGLQLGLINMVRKSMAGYQIGLVNFGGDMNGTQLGLVNINKSTDGTPVGLFTVDSEAFIRILASDLFITNFEIATGTKKMYNTISVSYNLGDYLNKPAPKWALGYSLGKIWYSQNFFLGTDLQVQHINLTSSFTKSLSLSGKGRVSVGLPLNLGFTRLYFLSGLTFSSYAANSSNDVAPDFMSFQKNTAWAKQIDFWPGFMIGIQSR